MNDTLRQRLGVSAAQLADCCRRWKITELAVFGSALRDDFRPDSDVDLLVQFAPDATWSLFDHVRMERELEEMAEREVDLLTRRAVEESRNWIRRKAILESARSVYESR
ncbi:MAG: nucleotidyltransferase [Bacteroidetes bacterium]|nr:nucleotidyltransferase [Bacteroidota bacterium]